MEKKMAKQLNFSDLNTMGRLGNNCFAIAGAYGLARRSGRQLTLPKWRYAQYFNWSSEIVEKTYPWITPVKEPYFHYCGKFFNKVLEGDAEVINIEGYLQSEKYFKEYETDIRKIFSWRNEFKSGLLAQVKGIFEKDVIAIHIRRGDYIGNENYHNLPVNYYVLALDRYFPDWMNKYNILVFSDDIPWCKTYFNGANIYFSEGRNEAEDLCLLSQCQNFILSNSSYSWWGAWLANTKGIVVRPTQLFEGQLKRWNQTRDFWLPQWQELDYTKEKLSLRDVEFHIPVHYDHSDRAENLKRIARYLYSNFDTNIVVGEQGSKQFANGPYYKYRCFEDMGVFHRTKMLNILCKESAFKIIVNYDADVIIPIIQIMQAVYLCRQGIGMVFPYDGRFARIPKTLQHLDFSELNTNQLQGSEPGCTISVGGCIFFRKEDFIKGGMENENFISYGPEDSERAERMGRVGVDVRRVKGPLYHYDHYIGPNSCTSHPYWEKSVRELGAIRIMSNRALKEYISTWPWVPK